MENIKLGWAEVDLTPDKKVSLNGQFAERISEYVEKPITATALAVTSGDEQMVLVSCDLAIVPWNLLCAVRAGLEDNRVGIDPLKIIMGAIHTHTGPVFTEARRTKGDHKTKDIVKLFIPPDKKYIERVSLAMNDQEIITPQEMFDLLVERLTQVILEAWNHLKEGSFVNAFGRAAVGMCRRVVYNDGSAKMWGDSNTEDFSHIEGGSDTGIELLYVYDDKKELSGIVANLACPAQCVQHRSFISPDFWGEVKMLLREYFGEKIFLLPLLSAAGDQCPVDLIRWVEPESDLSDPNIVRTNPLKRKADPSMFDLSGMRKIGRRIAREIIDVYEEGLEASLEQAEFKHIVRTMQLPVRRVSQEEADQAEKAIQDYMQNKEGDIDFYDVALLQAHVGILRRLEFQEVVKAIDTEIHIVRLGNIAIATNPFELFLDYGNQMKARSHAEQTFLIELANGWDGYLPTERAEKGGHYSAFVCSGQVGHIGGDQLVKETLEVLNTELFAGK